MKSTIIEINLTWMLLNLVLLCVYVPLSTLTIQHYIGNEERAFPIALRNYFILIPLFGWSRIWYGNNNRHHLAYTDSWFLSGKFY